MTVSGSMRVPLITGRPPIFPGTASTSEHSIQFIGHLSLIVVWPLYRCKTPHIVSELLKSPRVLGLPGENDLSQSPHVPWKGKLKHAPPRRKSVRLVGHALACPSILGLITNSTTSGVRSLDAARRSACATVWSVKLFLRWFLRLESWLRQFWPVFVILSETGPSGRLALARRHYSRIRPLPNESPRPNPAFRVAKIPRLYFLSPQRLPIPRPSPPPTPMLT